MKLHPTQTDSASLIALGEEASSLLIHHDYADLARRFGYALACGRSAASAIEADWMAATSSPITAKPGAHLPNTISLRYFAPNSAGLFAVIACPVRVSSEAFVLLELVVTGGEEEKHITLEDISGATPAVP